MITQIQNEIINILSKDKNNLSITFVGSSNFKKIEKISDIDIVIICKKLTKSYYEKQLKNLKNLNKNLYIKKFEKIYINDTFGPLKFNTKGNLVLHIMIYDITSHKKHVIESPFTCLDWSLYNSSFGPNLRDIFPVFNLQIDDFKKSRRNINDYQYEFNNRKLSYRVYSFNSENEYKELKKYKGINDIEIIEFMNHIIKFSIINLCKLISNKNKIFTKKEIYSLLPEFKKFESLSYKLDRSTSNLEKLNFKEVKSEFKSFIKFYNNFLNQLEINYKSQYFYLIRHSKTKLNNGTFLGRRDPDIKNKLTSRQITYFKKIKVNKYYTSPSKRAENSINQITKDYKKDSNLLEINYGDAEGLNFKEIKKKFPHIYDAWNEEKDVKFPNGESIKDVEKRFFKFLNANIKYLPFMAFTHQVVIRVALCHSIMFNINKAFKLKVPHLKPLKFYIYNKNLKIDLSRKELYKMLKNE